MCSRAAIIITASSAVNSAPVIAFFCFALFNFYCAMLCISAVYASVRCPSVCLSVTFVDHVKTNKRIFEIFLPPGSHTILAFPH